MVIAAGLAFASALLAVAGLGALAPVRASSRTAAPRALRLLAALGSGAAGGRHAPQDLERRIAAAGRPAGLEARELLAAKLASTVAGGAAGVLLGAIAPGRLGLLLVLAGPAAGFMAPDAWHRRAGQRARRV
ncbi:MAG: hypothetical protein WKF49_05850, partial [Thermoleophilaceae bacterium]